MRGQVGVRRAAGSAGATDVPQPLLRLDLAVAQECDHGVGCDVSSVSDGDKLTG